MNLNTRKSSKRWVFTYFNIQYRDDHGDDLMPIPAKTHLKRFQFMQYGLEKCPRTGTEHYQGYVEFNTNVDLKGVQSFLNHSACHCEIAKGTLQQNLDYTSKEGKVYSFGTPLAPEEGRSQGERTDLQHVRFMGIHMNIPDMIDEAVIKNYQGLKMAEALESYKELSFDFKPKKVFWFYGATGTGKSKTAMEMCKENAPYFKCEPACEWYDGYWGQTTAWFDDFRGTIEFHILLQILDGYEMRLRKKGSFVIWNPDIIIITSSKHWCDLYSNYPEDLGQLDRRISETRLFSQL